MKFFAHFWQMWLFFGSEILRWTALCQENRVEAISEKCEVFTILCHCGQYIYVYSERPVQDEDCFELM